MKYNKSFCQTVQYLFLLAILGIYLRGNQQIYGFIIFTIYLYLRLGVRVIAKMYWHQQKAEP